MSLTVVRVTGLTTVQDLGRPGRMHEALAPGGALVPELLVAANRAAENPDDVPAIEVLGRLVVRAESPIQLSTGPLATGEEVTIESEPLRVAYLALRGGVQAPRILGGFSCQLSAGLGAPLRAGDRLVDQKGSDPITAFSADLGAPLRVGDRLVRGLEKTGSDPITAFPDVITILPGPDAGAFVPDALDRLTAAPYRILPTSDRVGTRLDGAPIPHVPHAEFSRPMVRGAIEVPRDGAPIVLGPEHPTTGGYPIAAVIAHADLGRFFAIRLGGTVRFRVAAKTKPR